MTILYNTSCLFVSIVIHFYGKSGVFLYMDMIAGIVAEYNPFHNGHQYQIKQARLRGAHAVIAVMSGHFLQRGEPALADKWQRAGWAVASGVDLVIELPFTVACRSADHFATGAVRLLASLGPVTHLVFGAESSYSLLEELTQTIRSHETQLLLKEHLNTGLSYPAALQKAVEKKAPLLVPALRQPNNILALSYLNALQTYASGIKPMTIARHESAYHDTTVSGSFASASAIRACLTQKGLTPKLQTVMPAATWLGLLNCAQEQRLLLTADTLSRLLLYRLRLDKIDGRLPILGEGLENRLEKKLSNAFSFDSLLDSLKSKRYPRTRLTRQLLHYLLSTPDTLLQRIDRDGPPYARVLAFNDTGRRLLHRCRKQASVPLITRVAPYASRVPSLLTACLQQDIKATECYDLLNNMAGITTGGRDFTTSPLYYK